MKSRFTALVVLLVCGCSGLLAQPLVDITVASGSPADTTIDFGVTFVGNQTRRSISIRNRGTDTAVVLGGAQPFVDITNLPWVPAGDTRYENFAVDTPFPVVIPPGQVALIELRYRALQEPSIPIDSAVEAQARVRVARVGAIDGPFAERTFRLRGRRTASYLITETPTIAYDSVYVNRRLGGKTFNVRNLQTVGVPIERQTLDIKTSVVGEPEITVEIKPSVIIGGLSSEAWNVAYQPRNLGLDSAVFTIQYRLDTTAGPVTLDTRISGVGVEQRLRIVDVQTEQTGTGLRWSGDTVDFGTVASAQDTVRALIVVENAGNLDPRILSEQKRLMTNGTATDTTSFIVQRPLADGLPIIVRDVRDTLIVTYAPTAAGESVMRYAITTDIQSRKSINAVPLGAEVMSFVMIGRQRRARVSVDPQNVTFDTVAYSASCTSVARDSIRVTNTGDRALEITAVRSRNRSLALQATPQVLTIAPMASAIIALVYRPEAEGSVVDTIDIISNAAGQETVGIPYSIVAQRLRDTISVVMPDTITARPGFENVIIDVTVSSPSLASLSACVLSMAIDTTVLRFERALSLGTATEIAGAPQRLNDAGYPLRLSWSSPSVFLNRPVFTRLVFSAVLGDRLDSPLGVVEAATTFGTSTCPDLVPVSSASGVFRIDSLCGLSYKTAMLRNQAMAGVFPNPVVHDAKLTVVVPRREHLRAVCVDAFGRERSVVVDHELDAGTYTFDLDADALPPAAYSIIVWSGSRYLAVPFVVGR